MRNQQFAIFVLVLGVLACGQTTPRQLSLYVSATAEIAVSPLVVQVTTTPNATQTPNVVVISATPAALGVFCVNAPVAVHLRPSPNAENYPIMAIPNGTKLLDLGGRSGKWAFVELGDKQGWVNGAYVGDCR
jgi:hypothetical protein